MLPPVCRAYKFLLVLSLWTMLLMVIGLAAGAAAPLHATAGLWLSWRALPNMYVWIHSFGYAPAAQPSAAAVGPSVSAVSSASAAANGRSPGKAAAAGYAISKAELGMSKAVEGDMVEIELNGLDSQGRQPAPRMGQFTI